MRNPQMSPLFVAHWEKATEQEKAAILDGLRPVSALKPGESFQVGPDGAFVRLPPGAIVPEVPIKDKAK